MGTITATIKRIQIPPDKQDRSSIDPEALKQLAQSIDTHGLLQPIVLAQPENGHKDFEWVLVAGERRLRAAQQLGWTEIPALVVEGKALDEVRAVENLQRVDLNAIETAIAVGDLVAEQTDHQLAEAGFASGVADIPARALAAARIAAIDHVAARLGKPAKYIRDQAFMAELDAKTRKLVVDGRLPVPHARELAKVLDADKRYEIALRAAADPRGDGGRQYAWPIADLRREVAKVYQSLAMVPWKLCAEFAGKPACIDCPENSANRPGLFENAAPMYGHAGFKEPAAGICLSRSCFGAKSAAVTRAAGTVARLTVSAAKPAKGKAAAAEPAKPIPEAPVFVQPAKFKTAVAEKVEAAKTARKDGAGKSSVPKVLDAAQEAHSAAQRAHERAVSDWFGECIKIFQNALDSRPWLRVYLGPMSPNADSPKLAKKIKTLLPRVLALQTTPELALLAECVECDKYSSWSEVDWWVLRSGGFFPAIAAGLKVEIPPAPEKPAAAIKGKGRKGGGK